MPASQEQKVDFLLKKIGYSASKTGIAEDSSLSGSTKKAPFAEAIASPLVIPASTIWSESGLIPATPPGSDTAYVKVYSTSSAYRMTHDATVGAARRTFIARSSYGDQSSSIDGDWIDTQFGADYIIQVYKGDPNSGGVALQQAGANAGTDGWFFDYSSGVLNFNGTNLPSGITETNIYIVGYRYTGRKGVQPEAGIGTFHDLIVSNNFSVGGISTFTGLIDANGIIEATAGQNKIPSLYSSFSDLPNASTYHGMFAHVHATGRGYFAHAGNWMELVNKETTGVVGTGTERYDIGPVDATSLNVTGITTLGSIGISTGRITGPSITYIDPATVGAAGTVVILGNLQVEGTQTTVNSSTMTVTDKNIVLAKNATNDAAADGGGITVKSGDGNKTWQWVDATNSWTANHSVRVPDDRVFGFATDTNTYIHRPDADTIAFTTGGNRRVTINSDGNVIIGTTSWAFEKPLNVQGSSGSIISLYNGDTTTYAANTNVGIEFKLRTGNTGTQRATCEIRAFKENGTNGDSARALSFYTGISGGSPTERLRINSDGRLLVSRSGLTASKNVGTKTGEIQVAAGGNNAAITLINYSNDASSPYLMLGKSRAGNTTDNTIVQADDRLGEIAFCGADGNDIDSFGAAIKAWVDGTPGSNDMPGRLVFYTTPDGGTSAAERMVIKNDGKIGINSTNPANKLDVCLGAAWIYPDEDGTEAVALKLGKLKDFNSPLNEILVSDNDGSSTPTYQVTNKFNRYIANWHFDRVTSPGATRINGFKFRSAIDGTNLGNKFTIRDLHDTADSTVLWSNGDSFIGVTTDGTSRNLGIGTDSPDTLLHLHSSSPIIKIEDVTATQNQFTRLLQIGAGFRVQLRSGSNDGTLTVQGYGDATTTNFIRVENDGKVGINSSSPTRKLDVVGENGSTATFKSAVSPHLLVTSDANLNEHLYTSVRNGITIKSTEATLDLIAQGSGTHAGSFLMRDSSHDGFGFVNDFTNKELQLKSFTSSGTAFSINSTGSNVSRLDNCIVLKKDGSVKLFNDGNQRLVTTNTGVSITDNLNVAGISTFTGAIDANGDLDVDGHTELDNLNVSGVSTFSNTTFTGTISAGSTTGVDGYYLKSTGIGVTWTQFPTARNSQVFTVATAGQTTFNFTYNVNYLDVFVNGVKLPASEFTASNGTSVVLDDGCFVNDTVELITYNTVPSSSSGAQALDQLNDVSITGTPVVGETLQHNGSEFVNDYTPTATLTSTTQVVILSLPIATYRSAEYTIQVTEGTKYHVTKILAIHDGTNVTFNEYGTLTTSTSLSTFALDVNSGNMRLLVTPASTNSTVFKVKFTAIKV